MAIRVVRKRQDVGLIPGCHRGVWKICFFQLNLESEGNEPLKRCHSKKKPTSKILNSTRGIFRGALISLTNHDSIGNWVAFANSGQGFLD